MPSTKQQGIPFILYLGENIENKKKTKANLLQWAFTFSFQDAKPQDRPADNILS